MNALKRTITETSYDIFACAISPDGSWLLSASSDSTLKIWDATTKISGATMRVNGALRSCLFCGDRYHIIAGGEDGVYFLRAVDNE